MNYSTLFKLFSIPRNILPQMDSYSTQRAVSSVEQRFQITGADCQVLTVGMGGGEKLISQPGKSSNILICFKKYCIFA